MDGSADHIQTWGNASANDVEELSEVSEDRIPAGAGRWRADR